MKRNSQSGVALVITLILLSVITFMAVTFLVVSRHEGAQVDQITQQTMAENAAESGLQQAMAQIVAQMQANTNGLNFGLLVSTNYQSPFFDISAPPAGLSAITNVNYRDQNGALLSGANLQQMLNNMLILPRAPVFVYTNKNTPPDFRYWHDLNRNGVYDTNGLVFEVDDKGNLTSHVYVGDPEWIGILNHPEQRHSSSNFFLQRYCFIALPIGNSLDINYIHNAAKQNGVWEDDFYRNQGVGSWEINLAAFLHEVNPNWDNVNAPYGRIPYFYNTNTIFASGGSSFDDANAILEYRIANNYNTLRSFKALYLNSPLALTSFTGDFIDGYCHGPLMTGLTYTPLNDPDSTFYNSPWCGDYSTNQYFDTQDLFNRVPYYQPSPNPLTSFSNHLYSIGRTYTSLINSAQGSITNSYNRYTFYNLLSQMSFGSASEPAEFPYMAAANPNYSSVYANTPRMNLNYVNVNGLSATNFVSYTPAQFFTNAADRMLRAYFPNPIGVTNGQPAYLSLNYIPIYPTNYYTPAVHRILQLAANMYDASVNKQVAFNALFDYPSVFKPYFAIQSKPGQFTNVYVAGYVEVGTNVNQFNIDVTPPKDLRRDLSKILASGTYTPNSPAWMNIYGVPYVIGAKSGLPSFNKFVFTPIIQMGRKLQIVKPSAGAHISDPGWQTNIQYTLSISNAFGVDCWYPYTNQFYSRSVTFYVTNDMNMVLTNNVNAPYFGFNPTIVTNIGVQTYSYSNSPSAWAGSPNLVISGPIKGLSSNSFKVPMTGCVIDVPDTVLRLNPNKVVWTNLIGGSLPFDTLPTNGWLIPRFGLNITNRVRFMMVDTATGRLIDYVQLGGLSTMPGLDANLDIAADLYTNSPTLWGTNAYSAANITPYGIFTQILVSRGTPGVPTSEWTPVKLPANSTQIQVATSNFNSFFFPNGDGNATQIEAPFVALTKYQRVYTWSVNDPLVHYMLSDLTDLTTPNLPQSFGATNALATHLRVLTTNRYQPWGQYSTQPQLGAVKGNEWAYKDPQMLSSDSWQFPTNKYPNVGWLGRVHRGTPWQTVFLKSPAVDTNNWMNWTGDNLYNYFGLNDPQVSNPKSDYILMDLFTTAPNDNASKGQLSINQSGLAAWAAVLDGVITLTNSASPLNGTNLMPWVISPRDYFQGTTTNMAKYLVDNINATRSGQFGGTFTSLGQICAVPQLTVNSPFFNTNNAGAVSLLNDAAYERIPQQIMSLLRVGTPRYVIFAYGQSLKPADHSIVQSGPFFGMCTNYQITGEVATRAVVRFDNFPTPGHPSNPRAVIESFNVLPPE